MVSLLFINSTKSILLKKTLELDSFQEVLVEMFTLPSDIMWPQTNTTIQTQACLKKIQNGTKTDSKVNTNLIRLMEFEIQITCQQHSLTMDLTWIHIWWSELTERNSLWIIHCIRKSILPCTLDISSILLSLKNTKQEVSLLKCKIFQGLLEMGIER